MARGDFMVEYLGDDAQGFGALGKAGINFAGGGEGSKPPGGRMGRGEEPELAGAVAAFEVVPFFETEQTPETIGGEAEDVQGHFVELAGANYALGSGGDDQQFAFSYGARVRFAQPISRAIVHPQEAPYPRRLQPFLAGLQPGLFHSQMTPGFHTPIY